MNWADQFAKGWHGAGAAEYLFGKSQDDSLEISKAALPALSTVITANFYADAAHYANLTESPIEEAMFWALMVAGLQRGDAVRFDTSLDPQAPDVFFIQPQAQLGKYRADFVVIARNRWGYGPAHADARVIVECDGHDFHERTKQQAQRDKSRDRTLQDMGYAVLRFTGSEIFKDPLACAREALEMAQNAAARERK